MTSIIKFTPLCGGLHEKGPIGRPHCYLLEVDAFCFLLDCGWDLSFTEPYVLNGDLANVIPKIDAVLLSYPDTFHLGALPYAVGRLGLNCPIYGTVPVYKMGQMFMYDAYQSRKNVEEFDLFSLDEVDKAFELMTQLKYNQTVNLKGKGEGISITPLPAGHMLGGTIWKIVKDGEEDIIYAVDFNHKKEQHLNGCNIEKIQRPSLLITDAYNAKVKQIGRRQRDESLMTKILQTLRSNGNVLICVDTAGRVLELTHMIDHLWQLPDSGLLAYSLALVNNVSYNVIEFAKSQIEWMSDKLMKNFEGRRNNPFQFKHLKLCHNMNEVNKVPSPKVVLASTPNLESGFSRELFQAWCSNPNNSIILTTNSSEGTLAHDLKMNGSNRTMKLTVKKRVKLSGTELEEYRKKEQEEKAKTSPNPELTLDDESSSDEEMPLGPTSGPKKKKVNPKHDIIARGEVKQQVGFFKSVKTKYPMFPFHEEKIRWDDYGELIKPEEWMDLTIDPSSRSDQAKQSNGEKLQGILDEPEVSEIPTKCVSSVQNFHVKCKIHFIDFEGRSDADSIMTVLRTIKPRRTIVVHGKEEHCQVVADFCKQIAAKMGDTSSQQQIVFTPRNGEVIDATTESYIYQVRLPESLVSQLVFNRGKDGLLAWVDGTIAEDAPQEDISEGEAKKQSLIPSLLPLPEDEIPGHPTVFVNELKLSDFKLVLLRHGIPSEFIGGVLFCGNQSNVALRRHDSGRVTIEGTLCEEYYKVRELLYEQYAIV